MIIFAATNTSAGSALGALLVIVALLIIIGTPTFLALRGIGRAVDKRRNNTVDIRSQSGPPFHT